MKFWQCILNLLCHHLSKFVVTIGKMTSLKNDVLSRWPPHNFDSWTYFSLKLCQLNLVILIQNLVVPFFHLSQSCFDTIACTLNFKFGQKVHFVILLNNFDFGQFLLIPVCKIHISGWSILAIPYFKKQNCFWLEILTSDRYQRTYVLCKIWPPACLVYYRQVRKLPTCRHFDRATSTIKLNFSQWLVLIKKRLAKNQLDHVTNVYFTD